MTTISAKQKQLLNDFQETQPALQDQTAAGAPLGVELGSLVEAGVKSVRKLVKKFSVTADGGAQGTYTLNGDQLPADAIVTKAIVSPLVTSTSAGAPTIQFSQGATDLTSAFDPTALAAPADETQAIASSAVPGGAITATIATADLTAGEILLYIEYIDPTELS